MTVNIPASFPAGALTNTASATTTTGNPDRPPVVADATVDVAIVADLDVIKTLMTDPVVAGQPVTYDVSVTNNGPSDAPDVLFTDTLPPGTFVEAGLPAFCTAESAEGATVIACQGPVLPVGQTVSAQVTLGTSPGLTGTLSNTAFVGSGALDNQLSGQHIRTSRPRKERSSTSLMSLSRSGPTRAASALVTRRDSR